MSFLFFFKQMAFFQVFLRAISFFQSLFRFCFRCKSSIFQVLSTWGYPKRRKLSLLFFCNQTAFFHAFLRAISFFQSLFRFCLTSKSSIFKSRAHRGTPKGGKMSLVFFSNETAFFNAFLRAI